MNYRIFDNPMNNYYEIINLTSKVVVKRFTVYSKALTYLKIINNPRHRLEDIHAKVS